MRSMMVPLILMMLSLVGGSLAINLYFAQTIDARIMMTAPPGEPGDGPAVRTILGDNWLLTWNAFASVFGAMTIFWFKWLYDKNQNREISTWGWHKRFAFVSGSALASFFVVPEILLAAYDRITLERVAYGAFLGGLVANGLILVVEKLIINKVVVWLSNGNGKNGGHP